MVKSVDEALAGAHARAAAAEERLRDQTLVRAEAEHRLKTSLAVIGGWATTLDERWDQLSDERRREAVGVIRRASEELANQAQGLLEEARAELRSLEHEPVVVDLGAVLGTAPSVFGGMGQHVIDVELVEEPVLVEIDPAALQQVLGHLLENALKYSPEGSRVVVSLSTTEDGAVLDVRDEGPGVPDDLDVFAPFTRGPGTEGRPGVGLGLYVVRNLVRAMGGEVSAGANPGGGSVFSVQLPTLGKGSKDPVAIDLVSPSMDPCRSSATETTSRS